MSSIVISGNTSGAITLQAPAVAGTTTHTLPATTGTVLNDATCGVCRAWVNFNGTGTIAIRSSFNVSSITDGGAGLYTINFTTNLSDANYAVVNGGQQSGTSTGGQIVIRHSTTPSVSAYQLETTSSGGATPTDWLRVCSAVFQ